MQWVKFGVGGRAQSSEDRRKGFKEVRAGDWEVFQSGPVRSRSGTRGCWAMKIIHSFPRTSPRNSTYSKSLCPYIGTILLAIVACRTFPSLPTNGNAGTVRGVVGVTVPEKGSLIYGFKVYGLRGLLSAAQTNKYKNQFIREALKPPCLLTKPPNTQIQ